MLMRLSTVVTVSAHEIDECSFTAQIVAGRMRRLSS